MYRFDSIVGCVGERKMEGIRAIVIAYYDRATRGEKDLVKQYFNKFDINGDGKITFKQYKNGVAKHLSNENIFRKLDANGDGSLDFDDIVCLYYMENKLGLHKCASCRDLLVGAYFSCLRCLEDGLDAECRLCCACYHLGGFSHEHPLSNFLDQHTMAKVMKNHTPDARRDRGETELEELRKIAKSYYYAGSQEVQNLAHKFFDSMDMDGDGKVDCSEFLEFMKEEGYTRMQNPKFFKELDVDGNGTLDFDEVMTAYYISKSGRPFCDKCGDFIRGIFFSCVDCYRNPKGSFNLCCDCYRSRKCDHKHDGRAQFLDNFALLEALKLDSGPTIQAATKSDQQNHQVKSPVPSNSQTVATKTKSPLIPSNKQAKSHVSSHTTTGPAAYYTNNVIYNTFVVNPPPPVTDYYNAVIPPHRVSIFILVNPTP
ncbi:uncharacterized protein LOC142556295 [Primulina tabacum]|uniref:uncharacterized protein LOC142556295 n=1 Tax=Primulina tabacum TaxID=48773 RepID=UPI003F5928B8